MLEHIYLSQHCPLCILVSTTVLTRCTDEYLAFNSVSLAAFQFFLTLTAQVSLKGASGKI